MNLKGKYKNCSTYSADYIGLANIKYLILTVVALSEYVIAFPIACAPNSRLWIVKTIRALLRP